MPSNAVERMFRTGCSLVAYGSRLKSPRTFWKLMIINGRSIIDILLANNSRFVSL